MNRENLALVADPAGDTAERLRPLLKELGLETIAARDGNEALRLIGRDAPVLVLADTELTEPDGFALCARLREEGPNRSIPIVLLGARDDRLGRLAALGAGADDFIGKPLDLEEVKPRLAALLRRLRARSADNGRGGARCEIPSSAPEGARELYARMGQDVHQALDLVRRHEAPEMRPIEEDAQWLVEAVDDRSEWIRFALEATEIEDLAAHHVNVAILAVALSGDLGLPEDQKRILALLGLVHDFGMTRIPKSLLYAPRRLTQEEFQVIVGHPDATAEILRACGPSYEGLAAIARQEHEREKGQGYPMGLCGKETRELAKIIGVADVLEACTHPRSYCKTLIPYDALQVLIAMRGETFDPRHIKALLHVLTVFPLGSWVQLNSGEVGQVSSTSKRNLTRPVVDVLWSGRGERLESPKRVDLAENPHLFVYRPLGEEELPAAGAGRRG